MLREHAQCTTTLLATLLLAGCALLSGCGEPAKPPSYSSIIAEDVNAVPKTELQFELAATFDAGVGKLHGIATDSADRIYLVGSGGVRVLDADRKPLKSWSVPKDAHAVAVAPDGTVYVALTAKVLMFDPDGKPLGEFGVEGPGPGQLRGITSIAVAADSIFVADAPRNLCINRYALNGDFINDIGKRDHARGITGLIAPSPYLDFAVDAQGRLVVGNPGRGRMEIYQMDGTLVGTWGEPGTQPERFCGCCNPTNVAITREGNIVTSEKGIPRVKVYGPSGKMLAYIGPSNFPADSAGMDLAVDSKDRIYVVEPVKGVVMVFAPVKPKE